MNDVHTPTTQPHSRLKRIHIALILTLLLVAIALLIEGGRWYGEHWIAARLQTEAQQRGWSIAWGGLRLGRDLTFTLSDLSASDNNRTSVTLEQLRATWTWRGLLIKHEPHPQILDLHGLDLSLDGAHRPETDPTAHDNPDPDCAGSKDCGPGHAHPPNAASGNGGAAVAAVPPSPIPSDALDLLERFDGKALPRTQILLTGGRIRVNTGRPELPHVEVDQLQATGAHTHDGWRATWQARCTEGCGSMTVPLTGDLHRIQTGDMTGHLQCATPMVITLPIASDRLPIDTSPQAIVTLESARFVRDHHKGLQLAVENLTTRPMILDRWNASTHIARAELTLSRHPKTPLQLALHQPDLRLTPISGVPLPPPDHPTKDSNPSPDPEAMDAKALDIFLRQQLSALNVHAETALTRLSTELPHWVPKLSALTLHNGSLHVPIYDLHITEVDAAPIEHDGYHVWGRWRGMRLGTALHSKAPHITLLADAIPIPTLLAQAPFDLPDMLQQLDGQISGRLTVDLIQTPLPTVDVVTLANKRAQDPDEDDTNTPYPPILRPDPPATAQAGPSAAALQLTGQLNLIRPHLDLPPLAPEPIMAPHATITLELLGWWPQPTHGAAVELRRFALTLPSRHDPTQSATLRARWAARRLLDPRGRPPQLELDVWLEDSDCATAVGAIPKGMLPNLHDQLQVEGRFAPHLEFSVDMDDLYTVELEVTGLPGSCRITELGRYDPSYLAGNFKQEVREGVTRKGIFVGPDSGRYVPLFAMPHHLRLATYMTEEPRFYRNPGFDLKRTAGAIRLNLKHGRYVYGGSTLTQQLVKNLFLTRQKTLSRKLEEAFIVWKVEEILPKRRILELYLNCIEFGPNLYGIGRASWFYFGKPPSRLSVLESAFLAGIKPQPRMGIGPRARGHTSPDGFWPERLKRILGRMTRAGLRGASLPQEPYVVYFKTWKRRRR